jgi:hypothetical protein
VSLTSPEPISRRAPLLEQYLRAHYTSPTTVTSTHRTVAAAASSTTPRMTTSTISSAANTPAAGYQTRPTSSIAPTHPSYLVAGMGGPQPSYPHTHPLQGPMGVVRYPSQSPYPHMTPQQPASVGYTPYAQAHQSTPSASPTPLQPISVGTPRTTVAPGPMGGMIPMMSPDGHFIMVPAPPGHPQHLPYVYAPYAAMMGYPQSATQSTSTPQSQPNPSYARGPTVGGYVMDPSILSTFARSIPGGQPVTSSPSPGVALIPRPQSAYNPYGSSVPDAAPASGRSDNWPTNYRHQSRKPRKSRN